MDRLTARQRGYDARWEKARKTFLQANPLCVGCQLTGRYVPATCVDHVVPHKGDQGLFWDESNWQALCKHCHDVKTATEDGGYGRAPSTNGCGADGMPTSKNHPWNRAE
jgi:5-methylcytosine-specific restriction protein A